MKPTLHTLLWADRDALGKPVGGLVLTCPSEEDRYRDVPGPRRMVAKDGYLYGVAGGEGLPCLELDVGSPIWWVVDPIRIEGPPCSATGYLRLKEFNVEFVGTPSEAVDYLVRTPMHASAAVLGAIVHAHRDDGLAAVGPLGVAISARGPASAGQGGVAITLIVGSGATAGRGGIAVCGQEGVATSGPCGQSYGGANAIVRAGEGGLAVAGRGGVAAGTHAVVGPHGHVDLRPLPSGVFAGGEGSSVRIGETLIHAGRDYEPDVAYLARVGVNRLPEFQRAYDLDMFVERVQLNASCDLTGEAIARCFLENRPLCSDAAKKSGVHWTSAFRGSYGLPLLPDAAQQCIVDERRRFD